MALKKDISRPDGTSGNYIRIIRVMPSELSRDSGNTETYVHFAVFLDENAAKVDNCTPMMEVSSALPPSCLDGFTWTGGFPDAAAWIYSHKAMIDWLSDAEDILD